MIGSCSEIPLDFYCSCRFEEGGYEEKTDEEEKEEEEGKEEEEKQKQKEKEKKEKEKKKRRKGMQVGEVCLNHQQTGKQKNLQSFSYRGVNLEFS
ncbi:hypothetical protein STEG23_014298 [Scotinomys teguina]